jgi:hypothetical protein
MGVTVTRDAPTNWRQHRDHGAKEACLGIWSRSRGRKFGQGRMPCLLACLCAAVSGASATCTGGAVTGACPAGQWCMNDGGGNQANAGPQQWCTNDMCNAATSSYCNCVPTVPAAWPQPCFYADVPSTVCTSSACYVCGTSYGFGQVPCTAADEIIMAADECSSSPCQNGGACQPDSANLPFDSYSCACSAGYSGAHCGCTGDCGCTADSGVQNGTGGSISQECRPVGQYSGYDIGQACITCSAGHFTAGSSSDSDGSGVSTGAIGLAPLVAM